MPSSSAVHTTDCILHPAARIDFEQHVRLLWEAGRKDEAETLWNSVVEVQHQPAPRAPILHGTDLPAMAAVPCTEPECERCANRRGGFRFPWIGIWCKNGVLVRHGVPPQTAWTHWTQSTGFLDLLQLQMHGSGLSRANLVPEAWIKVVARASLKPGCATHEEVLMRWRDWQLGSETWIDPMTFLRRPSREEALMNVHRKAQRALLDWLASDPEYCLPCSCRSCGQATRNIWAPAKTSDILEQLHQDIDTWYHHETLRNDRGDTKNDDSWYTCSPDFIANIKSSGTMRDTQKTMTISATSFRGCNRFSPLLICHYCLVGVCQECDNNTRHNSPYPCCAEMAGSDHVRFSATPFRPDSTELEVFQEVVLRDG